LRVKKKKKKKKKKKHLADAFLLELDFHERRTPLQEPPALKSIA